MIEAPPLINLVEAPSMDQFEGAIEQMFINDFLRMDANEDGVLDSREVGGYLERLGIERDEEEVAGMI